MTEVRHTTGAHWGSGRRAPAVAVRRHGRAMPSGTTVQAAAQVCWAQRGQARLEREVQFDNRLALHLGEDVALRLRKSTTRDADA